MLLNYCINSKPSTPPSHPIPHHPTPDLERIHRKDEEVAEGVAGVAQGGDGGADEEGFLSEGVVPVVTEVAGLQDEVQDTVRSPPEPFVMVFFLLY